MHMDLVPPPTPSLTAITIAFFAASAVMLILLFGIGTGLDLIGW